MSSMDLGQIGKFILSSCLLSGIDSQTAEDILFSCSVNNEPFTDRDFPASFSSLSHNPSSAPKHKIWSKYRWARISSLSSSLEIFKEEVSPLDIIQGALGDSNFLCALSSLCEIPGLIQDLFITKTQNEFGFYAVRICKDGKWTDIFLDDFFPCGLDGTAPCFSHSLAGELWVMILEKAWAKRCGSYENTENSDLSSCLHDLTGAPTSVLACAAGLWDTLLSCKAKNYIVCASASSTRSSQRLLENMGLIGSLSYSVLQTADVGEKIVKLRNPWSKVEWNGEWSDGSEKWNARLKKKLGYVQAADGTFWMSFNDFIEYFSFVTICEIDQSFTYCSISLRQEIGEYRVISIEVTNNDEYSFSVDQKDKLYMNTIYEGGYSSCRVVLCRENKGKLEYISGYKGKMRHLWRKFELEKGKYFVFILLDWETQVRDYVFSAYSRHMVFLKDLGMHEGFLEKTYKGRAEMVQFVVDYSSIGIDNCWKYHEILPEGFGYYYIQNMNQQFGLREKTYFKRFKNLKMLAPWTGSSYEVTVKPNSDCIILLKVVADEKYFIESSSTYLKDDQEILVVEE